MTGDLIKYHFIFEKFHNILFKEIHGTFYPSLMRHHN